jgi:magnesium-transporting ATPase (P-type)
VQPRLPNPNPTLTPTLTLTLRTGATEAAKAAADIILTTPGLSAIFDAIVESRRIFQRLQAFIL